MLHGLAVFARHMRHVAIMIAIVFSLGMFAADPVRAAHAAQKTFASADEAALALAAAVQASDTKAILEILGAGAKSIVESGDPVADRRSHDHFVGEFEQGHSIVPSGDSSAVFQIGADQWQFPIPLVKNGSRWQFDTAAGIQEIINRRIGRNELATIQACLAVVDAQREYYERNPEGGPLHYAARIASDKGTRNGLYWKTAEDEPDSPSGCALRQRPR